MTRANRIAAILEGSAVEPSVAARIVAELVAAERDAELSAPGLEPASPLPWHVEVFNDKHDEPENWIRAGEHVGDGDMVARGGTDEDFAFIVHAANAIGPTRAALAYAKLDAYGANKLLDHSESERKGLVLSLEECARQHAQAEQGRDEARAALAQVTAERDAANDRQRIVSEQPNATLAGLHAALDDWRGLRAEHAESLARSTAAEAERDRLRERVKELEACCVVLNDHIAAERQRGFAEMREELAKPSGATDKK